MRQVAMVRLLLALGSPVASAQSGAVLMLQTATAPPSDATWQVAPGRATTSAYSGEARYSGTYTWDAPPAIIPPEGFTITLSATLETGTKQRFASGIGIGVEGVKLLVDGVESPNDKANVKATSENGSGASGSLTVRVVPRGPYAEGAVAELFIGPSFGPSVTYRYVAGKGSPAGAGKPCPPEVVSAHENLLREAALLRLRIAYYKDFDDRKGEIAIEDAVDSLKILVDQAAAGARSATTEYRSLDAVARNLSAAGTSLGTLRGESQIGKILEQNRTELGSRIFQVRERAESLGCKLVIPPELPPQRNPARVALVAAQSTPNQKSVVVARHGGENLLTFIALAADDDKHRSEDDADLRLGRLLAELDNLPLVRLDAGTAAVAAQDPAQPGPQVDTPEASIKPINTLYLVHRDPRSAATFVHVAKGSVTIAPKSGGPLRIAAGQSALVTSAGAKTLGPAATTTDDRQRNNPLWEYETNRSGGDYRDFSAADAQRCFDACKNDNRCQAWSFVAADNPGANTCFLKDRQAAPKANPCCISGTFTRVIDRRADAGPSGTWSTPFGELVLNGGSGTYGLSSGRVVGQIQGDKLVGHWVQSTSGQRCSTARLDTYYWGRLEFTFDANGNFTGKWGYCDGPLQDGWTGARK